MAAVKYFYGWDWKGAEAEERRAIELNPNFGEAHHLLAYILLSENRLDEAVESQRKSAELDPFVRPWGMAKVLAYAGRYAEAEAEYRKQVRKSTLRKPQLDD